MTKTDDKRIKREILVSDHALTPEDRSLWEHVISDVEPLNGRLNTLSSQSLRNKKKTQKEKPVSKFQSDSVNGDINPKIVSLKHGYAPGLDNRTKIRLRRGQISIEAGLDLHGMTQTEAHEKLIEFLKTSYTKGQRAVLVITGKGSRSDGQKGILRGAVPYWLNQPPLQSIIRAFDHAAPRDGGEGALYVLLRRQK